MWCMDDDYKIQAPCEIGVFEPIVVTRFPSLSLTVSSVSQWRRSPFSKSGHFGHRTFYARKPPVAVVAVELFKSRNQ